jgi:hypothetical protein
MSPVHPGLCVACRRDGDIIGYGGNGVTTLPFAAALGSESLGLLADERVSNILGPCIR